MPYDPSFYAIFWGHVFCKYGGCQNCFQKLLVQTLLMVTGKRQFVSKMFAHDFGAHQAMKWGVQNVWEEENVPSNSFWTPQRERLVWSVFRFLTRKTRAATPEGVETYQTMGIPLFGRGVICEVFLTPPFSTRPHGVL